MSKLIKTISKDLLSGQSVALIGPSKSGKTWFAKTYLMAALNKPTKIDIDYLKNCNQDFSLENDVKVRIVDEFETFIDKEHLERCYPDQKPYYADKYIAEVDEWHKKLITNTLPSLYIITRNENSDINYLVKNLKTLDWGEKVKTYKFFPIEK